MVAISLKAEILALAEIIRLSAMKDLNNQTLSAELVAEARIAIKIANTLEVVANKH